MKMAEPVHLKVVPYPEAHIGSPADGIIICYGDSIVLDARDSEVGARQEQHINTPGPEFPERAIRQLSLQYLLLHRIM